MIVLGVETSCDETAVAIVKDGKEILGDCVFSQAKIHEQFGGVVPEVASRRHIKKIIWVFEQALASSGLTPQDLDLVAVTTHPGLIGSLLVGINAAQAFALANDLPCIAINHLHGHIYANYIESDFAFPLLSLVVSGGHSELILMKDHYDFTLLGQTLDDAVGEAYDKVGRVLGLPYPGGPKVDRLAHEGQPTYDLPLPYSGEDNYNFSFSGLKSAVLNLLNRAKMKGEAVNCADMCASFQQAAVTVLVNKTLAAARAYDVKQIILAGGVAANRGLREQMSAEVAKLSGVKLTYPQMRYCTDNAVMIAVAGYFAAKCGQADYI